MFLVFFNDATGFMWDATVSKRGGNQIHHHLFLIGLINHKFIVSGHTHVECDTGQTIADHAKKKTIMKINIVIIGIS